MTSVVVDQGIGQTSVETAEGQVSFIESGVSTFGTVTFVVEFHVSSQNTEFGLFFHIESEGGFGVHVHQVIGTWGVSFEAVGFYSPQNFTGDFQAGVGTWDEEVTFAVCITYFNVIYRLSYWQVCCLCSATSYQSSCGTEDEALDVHVSDLHCHKSILYAVTSPVRLMGSLLATRVTIPVSHQGSISCEAPHNHFAKTVAQRTQKGPPAPDFCEFVTDVLMEIPYI